MTSNNHPPRLFSNLNPKAGPTFRPPFSRPALGSSNPSRSQSSSLSFFKPSGNRQMGPGVVKPEHQTSHSDGSNCDQAPSREQGLFRDFRSFRGPPEGKEVLASALKGDQTTPESLSLARFSAKHGQYQSQQTPHPARQGGGLVVGDSQQFLQQCENASQRLSQSQAVLYREGKSERDFEKLNDEEDDIDESLPGKKISEDLHQLTPSNLTSELERTLAPATSKLKKQNPANNKRYWNEKEDEELTRLVKQFGAKNWKRIASYLDNRTDVQCLHRWQKVLNPNMIKGPWSQEEDDKLIRNVMRHGAKNWSFIAQALEGRIGKQCRERWHNHLNPDIKKNKWSDLEDQIIVVAQKVYGNKWSEIAHFLPGRTDNHIKNRFNSTLKRKLKISDTIQELPPNEIAKLQTTLHELGQELEARRQKNEAAQPAEALHSDGQNDTVSAAEDEFLMPESHPDQFESPTKRTCHGESAAPLTPPKYNLTQTDQFATTADSHLAQKRSSFKSGERGRYLSSEKPSQFMRTARSAQKNLYLSKFSREPQEFQDFGDLSKQQQNLVFETNVLGFGKQVSFSPFFSTTAIKSKAAQVRKEVNANLSSDLITIAKWALPEDAIQRKREEKASRKTAMLQCFQKRGGVVCLPDLTRFPALEEADKILSKLTQ